jgi:hypothetical protein
LFEGLCRAAKRLALAGPVRDWIEADAPFPLIDVMGHAGSLADRPDWDIAIIDVPRLLVAVRFAAAGEGGHGL